MVRGGVTVRGGGVRGERGVYGGGAVPCSRLSCL